MSTLDDVTARFLRNQQVVEPTIVQAAKGYVQFQSYHDGALWYRLYWNEDNDRLTEHHLEFRVEVPSPHAGGEFLAQDKAIGFLRWIREELAMRVENRRLRDVAAEENA